MTTNAPAVTGSGTPEDPWSLTTPPGKSTYRSTATRRPTRLRWSAWWARPRWATTCAPSPICIRCSRSTATGWRWATPTSRSRRPRAASRRGRRSPENPVGGWYGLKKGLRGRFGNYVPPVLEALGLAEVEHNARNNRMRAL